MLRLRVDPPGFAFGPKFSVCMVEPDLDAWETNGFAQMSQPLTPEFVAALMDAAVKAQAELAAYEAKKAEAA